MKRFLYDVFVFTLFAACSYMAALFLVGTFAPNMFKKNMSYRQSTPSFINLRLKQVENVRNVDILVLGSSHAYRGYDPRLFSDSGINIFVLGSSAQTPLQTEVLLNQYLEKVRPKAVLLDVYPVLYQNDGVESAIDLLANGKIDSKMARMVFRTNNMKSYNTLLFAYMYQLLGLSNKYKEPEVKKTARYISGGYVQVTKTDSRLDNKVESGFLNMKPDQTAAIKRIVDDLKTRNVPYVVIQAPMPADVYATFKNMSAFDSLFASLGAYQNYNNRSDLHLTGANFLDNSHLNQSGVNLFNASLITFLKSDSSGLVKNQLTR